MAKQLYVGSLAWAVSNEQLRSYFEQIGEVEDAFVVFDRESGRSKGFGFVRFVSDEDADKAIEQLHETELEGRTIIVNEARPKE